MNKQNTPGIFTGALIGAMLTAALIAVFYGGWRLADLPFVPFDFFDWLTRVLPGWFIEFVISMMVSVIRTLHLGSTSDVAKLIEQAMGIGGLFFTGVVAGMVLFGVLRSAGAQRAYPFGIGLGLIISIPAVMISLFLGNTAAAPPAVNALWILLVFVVWGMALALAFQRLTMISLTAEKNSDDASVRRVSRRQFLVRLAGFTATITVSGAFVGMLSERHSRMRLSGLQPWSSKNALPNAGAVPKPAPGTRPEFTPLDRHYRIDINTVPPTIDEMTWMLKVNGLVEKPLSFTLDRLRTYEPMHRIITLSCISNPVGGDLISTTRWTGVSLKKLLPEFGLRPEATHLKIRSADGFWEVVPIEAIQADERIMLVYAWDGLPLLEKHGFPLRIYIPDVHGMKQPKWIESIEATGRWEPGYWVARGWDRVARMKATSVIDSVSTDMDIINATPDMRVPIGGIAHAGARGISKVEVRVDDGPWQEASLRAPLSGLTWVIWRFDWPFQSGDHTFTVRCRDGNGEPQIVEQRPPAPSGASGLFSKRQKF